MQQEQNYSEYKERLSNFSNEFDLGLFLHIVRKSMFWVISVLVVCILGAYLYLKYTAPVYRAKVVIQLGQNDNANRVLNVAQFGEDNDL